MNDNGLNPSGSHCDLIDSNIWKQAAKMPHCVPCQGALFKTRWRTGRSLDPFASYLRGAHRFPEEEIDFIGDGKVAAEIGLGIQAKAANRLKEANQGALIREGMNVVIRRTSKRPENPAYLTPYQGKNPPSWPTSEGTTRERLARTYISLDGMPRTILSTPLLTRQPRRVQTAHRIQTGVGRDQWKPIVF